MKNIPKWKYKRGVQDLICLVDINFLVCKKIYDLLPKDRIKANSFLLLSANNAFNEAIKILHTLLCSTKQEELTIKPLLEEIVKKEESTIVLIGDKKVNKFFQKIFEDYPSPDYFSYTFLSEDNNQPIGNILADISKRKRQSGLKDLDDIKKEFEDEDFHKIRHQSVVHKNKLFDDPTGTADSYLKENYIKNLGVIVKKLRINSYFWFDCELRNPKYKTIRDLELLVNNLTR